MTGILSITIISLVQTCVKSLLEVYSMAPEEFEAQLPLTSTLSTLDCSFVALVWQISLRTRKKDETKAAQKPRMFVFAFCSSSFSCEVVSVVNTFFSIFSDS